MDQHLLELEQATGIPAIAWQALRDYPERERVEPQAVQPPDFLNDDDGNKMPWPAPGTPIGLAEAARKYGVPHPTLSRWAKRGEIVVLERPAKNGLPMEVDERSVYDAVRWKTLSPVRGQNPLAVRRTNTPKVLARAS